MSNEPHVEVLSRNRVNQSTIIVAVIPTLAVVTVATVAIWPYLHTIGLALELLALTFVCCLAIAAIASLIYICLRFRIHLQHLDRQSRLLTWSDGAAWHTVDGEVVNLSAQHEEAKRPLQIAAPVTVKEVKAQPDRSDEEATILEMHSHGTSFKNIAASFKDAGNSYWTEYRVRQFINSRSID